MSEHKEFPATAFTQALREAAKSSVIQIMLTGTCTIKMTLNPETNLIEFEILDPFKGCECEE